MIQTKGTLQRGNITKGKITQGKHFFLQQYVKNIVPKFVKMELVIYHKQVHIRLVMNNQN